MKKLIATTITALLLGSAAANGAVWNTETVHSWSGRDCGVECDLALDSNGDPHFGYIVSKLSMPYDQVLYHAWKDGASWSHEQVYTNLSGASTDAAINMSGTTPTVYQIDDSIYGWRQGLHAHTKTGGVWSDTRMDEHAYGTLSAVSSGIAYRSRASSNLTAAALWYNGTKVDGDGITSVGLGCGTGERGGTIGISYFSNEDGGQLKLAENSGAGWTNGMVAPMSTITSGSRSDVAYDSQGKPHVAYSDYSNPSSTMLAYAVRDNGTWHTQQLVRCSGRSVSIVVDSKDRPHVLFPGWPSGLIHGVGNGTDWRFMRIGSVQWHSAFEIDGSDGLHAAFRYPATSDRLDYAVGEFVASNKLLNAQFDSDSIGWNFGEIEGDEGSILGSLTQITDPGDPGNKVCEINAHNDWGNSQCSAWLEQDIDVADKMQWLELDYQFLDPGTYIEVKLSTDWNDTDSVLQTLVAPMVPEGVFSSCGIPLPFNRQDAKDATLHIGLVGGEESDYYALVDNFELVPSGSPRLGKSAKVLFASAGQGLSPANASFSVWNTGTNDLAYSVSDNAGWMSLPDPTGTLSNQAETVEVAFDSASLSIGSYTGELTIVAAAASNPTSTVDVVLSIVPPPVEIATTALPAGEVGTAYSFQLETSNGVPPFTWTPGISSYDEASAANSYSYEWTGQYWRDDDATWELALPFSFPFFRTNYSTCWVDSNGRITFDNSGSDSSGSMAVFTNTPMIAVMWDDLTTFSGNIYVDEVAGDLVIRWDGDYVGGGSVGFSLTLADDGTITMKYINAGAWNANGGFIGISAGDGENYLVSTHSESGGMGAASDILFNPQSGYPDGLSLSTNGVLSGTPTAAFSNAIPFVVKENRGYSDRKWLGLLIEGGATDDADGDGIPDWWELLYFDTIVDCVATNHNDGDIFDNLSEYIAGTDPTNGASFFGITNAWPDAAGHVVQWAPSVSNRWYTMVWTNDLTGAFTSVVSGIDFPQSSATDTTHSAESEGFYRMEVQLK